MKNYFTSDTHFGHRNISGPRLSNWPNGYRIFDSIEDMDETILDGINCTVNQEDHLYILGDFTLGGKVQKYKDRIICKNITYILGNHDDRREIERAFGVMNTFDVLEKHFGSQLVFMSHYAHRVWNKSHRDSIHLYAHSHNSLEKEPWGKSMDVGVDAAYARFGDFRPFSAEEISAIMNKRDIKLVDHHGKARV